MSEKTISEGDWQDMAVGFIKYWQEQLGLRDWRIKVNFVWALMDCFASVKTFPQNRQADFRIGSAKSHEDGIDELSGSLERNLEVTVVHELLHVLTEPVVNEEAYRSKGSVEHARLEVALDAIAEALVRLRHGDRMPEPVVVVPESDGG